MQIEYLLIACGLWMLTIPFKITTYVWHATIYWQLFPLVAGASLLFVAAESLGWVKLL